jgi:hypothetical protein
MLAYQVLAEAGVSNFELREDFYLEHRTSEQTIFEVLCRMHLLCHCSSRRAAPSQMHLRKCICAFASLNPAAPLLTHMHLRR